MTIPSEQSFSIPMAVWLACCKFTADQMEPRFFLQQVHVSPTHIEASNGHMAIRWAHGAELHGETDALLGPLRKQSPLTAHAEILLLDNGMHWMNGDEASAGDAIWYNEEKLKRYPDLAKTIDADSCKGTSEPCGGFNPRYVKFCAKQFYKIADGLGEPYPMMKMQVNGQGPMIITANNDSMAALTMALMPIRGWR